MRAARLAAELLSKWAPQRLAHILFFPKTFFFFFPKRGTVPGRFRSTACEPWLQGFRLNVLPPLAVLGVQNKRRVKQVESADPASRWLCVVHFPVPGRNSLWLWLLHPQEPLRHAASWPPAWAQAGCEEGSQSKGSLCPSSRDRGSSWAQQQRRIKLYPPPCRCLAWRLIYLGD